jgi:hypothetical protein
MHSHPTRLCAALAIAFAAAACTSGTHKAADRRAEHAARGINERVALRGCVMPAPTGQGFALQHVMVLLSGEQPGGDAIDHPLIARGSWVRLEGGQDISESFKGYVNKEVTVSGEIVESGANTIGTAGHDAPSGNPPRASVANGDAPRVAVERVNKLAENCAGE